MDYAYRIFMFIFPYIVSIAGYIWVGRKAWQVPGRPMKVLSFVILTAGFGYTLYKLIRSVNGIFTNDNFEFAVIIVNVFVFFFAAIAITFGEPEKEAPVK